MSTGIELPRDLTILTLAKPFVQTGSDNGQNVTDSTILLADLAHYRDLFSKLRFSYVEQVTKERFLKAITSDPPAFVDPSDNATKETILLREKASLKEHKEEVREMIKGLEEQGKSLAERYSLLQTQQVKLEKLPQEIARLEEVVARLQSEREPISEDPELAMPLAPTMALLATREAELVDLDGQIEVLRQKLISQKNHVEHLEDDLVALRAKKASLVQPD